MKRFLPLLLLAAQACTVQNSDYGSTAREVFERSTDGAPVSDSLLVASYPKSVEEYRILREVMREVPSIRARDDLIEKRIRSGSLEVLKAHLRYAAFVEGEEAMWYVENLDPMIVDIPFQSVCEVTAEVTTEVGRKRLQYIEGLIRNCESKRSTL